MSENDVRQTLWFVDQRRRLKGLEMSNENKGNGHKHKIETPDVSHIRNVEVTHEQSDIQVGGVLAFMVALTIATIGVYIAMLLLFDYFNKQAEQEPRPGPMALSKQERLPPAPRLQAAPGFAVTLEKNEPVNLELREPAAEYRVVRAQWEQALRSGGRDQSGNVVGIPLDEAMQKLVREQRLPSRVKELPEGGQGGKPADYAIDMPTAASSGRATEKRVQ